MMGVAALISLCLPMFTLLVMIALYAILVPPLEDGSAATWTARAGWPFTWLIPPVWLFWAYALIAVLVSMSIVVERRRSTTTVPPFFAFLLLSGDAIAIGVIAGQFPELNAWPHTAWMPAAITAVAAVGAFIVSRREDAPERASELDR